MGECMQTRRRFLGAAALGLVTGSVPFRTRAQGIETAKIIVGFPPGGTTDVMARKVAEKLRGPYARSVIVDNRPGAGGQLGVVALKDSPARSLLSSARPATCSPIRRPARCACSAPPAGSATLSCQACRR